MSNVLNLMLLLLSFTAVGCSTQFTTLNQKESTSKVIYEISELHAFQIASSEIILSAFPGKTVVNLEGPVHGYSALFRAPPLFVDTYTHNVQVIPASGTDQNGRKLNGYYFEVSGVGSSFLQGKIQNEKLFERIKSAADKTGKGIIVVDVEKRPYDGVEWRYEVVSKNSNAGSVATNSASIESTTARLEKLKDIHDKGLITDADYEVKKKQILESL